MASTPAPDAGFTDLLRGPSYAVWKPIVGLVAVVLTMLVVPLFTLSAAAAFDDRGFVVAFGDYGSSSPTVTPGFLVALNLSLAAGILAAWFAVRVVHQLPIGFASSVLGRLRWRLMGLYALAAAATLLLVGALTFLVPQDPLTSDSGTAGEMAGSTFAFVLVLLLTTPLQAAGEEYVFRGYLMQAAGSLLGNRWVAVGFTAAAFAAVHGPQNLPLLADRFAFGVVAGVAVVITGGLEAALAMHVLNNLLALGIALALGDLGGALTATEASWWNLPITLTQSLVFLALVVWITRRHAVRSTTPALAQEPVTV